MCTYIKRIKCTQTHALAQCGCVCVFSSFVKQKNQFERKKNCHSEKKFTWKKLNNMYWNITEVSCATIVSIFGKVAAWGGNVEKTELTCKSNNNKHWKRGLGFGVNRIFLLGSSNKQTHKRTNALIFFLYIESIFGNKFSATILTRSKFRVSIQFASLFCYFVSDFVRM